MFKTLMVIGLAVMILSGCETLKGTASAPFIGMEKDVQNARKATLAALGEDPETGEKGVIKAMDDWIKKNMW